MRLLLLADIHIGSIKDTMYVYNTITNIIDKEIMFTKTDMVVILGDYFDKLFKVNDDNISLAVDVMSYIVRACKREKTKIRIVYGTESHEMNQYKIFNYHLTSKNLDMKVIDTVTEECVNGENILYVPEEYIFDKHKHYQKYLYCNKHYDYIFGHGIIEDGMPSIVSVSTESKTTKEKQVPRFKSGELSAASDITVFGHYHVHTKVNNSVWYLGSLFRNSFGEEEAKGYGIIEDHEFKFVENKEVYQYKTYEFNISSNVYDSKDELVNTIKQIQADNKEIFNGEKFGKIRLLFNTPPDIDPSFKENIKSIMVNDKNLALLIKESVPSETIIDEPDEDDEWDFILDISLPIEEKIYRFINKQLDDTMDMKKLMTYIGDIIHTINTSKNYTNIEEGSDPSSIHLYAFPSLFSSLSVA